MFESRIAPNAKMKITGFSNFINFLLFNFYDIFLYNFNSSFVSAFFYFDFDFLILFDSPFFLFFFPIYQNWFYGEAVSSSPNQIVSIFLFLHL